MDMERELFKMYRILCPPDFADGDVPALQFLFRIMRMQYSEKVLDRMMTSKPGKPSGTVHPDEVAAIVAEHWKLNCTFLNEQRTK